MLLIGIYLYVGAGEFRCLFFKGGSLAANDSSVIHRTPSVYLRPHDNRLAVRMTSFTLPALAADSQEGLGNDAMSAETGIIEYSIIRICESAIKLFYCFADNFRRTA